MENAAFTKPFLLLLAEIFGVSPASSGYVLETGKSGLMGTINPISASLASAPGQTGEATIAAHCGHILFFVRFFASFERGETPEADWPGSWKSQSLDEQGWNDLRSALQSEYDNLVVRLAQRETLPEEAIGASMILLAHCAYHVGEIRQRLLWLGARAA